MCVWIESIDSWEQPGFLYAKEPKGRPRQGRAVLLINDTRTIHREQSEPDLGLSLISPHTSAVAAYYHVGLKRSLLGVCRRNSPNGGLIQSLFQHIRRMTTLRF